MTDKETPINFPSDIFFKKLARAFISLSDDLMKEEREKESELPKRETLSEELADKIDKPSI